MKLGTDEFIRRLLSHVLPKGFHRIRHYGLVANVARARELLDVPAPESEPEAPEPASADDPKVLPRPCPYCGGRMIIIETFAAGCQPRHAPSVAGINSS